MTDATDSIVWIKREPVNEITEDLKIFYRYQEFWFWNGDETKQYIEVKLMRFVGYKKTPKGWWIIPMEDYKYVSEESPWRYSKKKWINDKIYRKSYAYPDKAGAMKNFMKRKEKHIQILKRNLEGAIEAFKQGQEIRDALIEEMTQKMLKGEAV